jgi:hypothetical protein
MFEELFDKMSTSLKGEEMKIDNVRISRLQITPAEALNILERNSHNRNLNVHRVERLAKSLRLGEWQFNAQPIQIAKDGTLLDGQHRLHACVMANESIDTLVVFNADPKAQETMDMGKARSVSDILKLRGYRYANELGALARYIAKYKKSNITAAMRQTSDMTPGQVLKEVELLTDSERYLATASKISKKVKLLKSVIAFMMWLTDQIDREDSDFFWEKLLTGSGLPDAHPILVLRNMPFDVRDIRRAEYQRISHAGLIAKAWNKYRCGETVQQLRFTVGGSRPDKMPELV